MAELYNDEQGTDAMKKLGQYFAQVTAKPLLKLLILLSACSANWAQAQAQIYSWQLKHRLGDFDVTEIRSMAQLKLVLKNTAQQPYRYFTALQDDLQPCQQLEFAMNAGMFHADYAPVGLYIEEGKRVSQLNTQTQGWGNFLIQPNGVLAWDKQPLLMTTQQYQQAKVQPKYATQSGPMLVIDGKINPNFIPDSDSRKIRNGVGLKDATLYFVISQQPINFYDFARLFQQQLKTPNALYLDGSVSSVYIAALKRHRQYRAVGPMLAYIDDSACATEPEKSTGQ
ncbi:MULTISPECIES: phosphodiester glycosidase family protein [unclassified Acinetobacter]|uniref:phosphodiester glycosidase family protein n=1 Tax=unclassified Acinetobacter TaxID=196816 RepID=UPI0015D43A9A|nr:MULTISPECIES: phosphodiester glycosidase family protein [unclassified Acinetobacter]